MNVWRQYRQHPYQQSNRMTAGLDGDGNLKRLYRFTRCGFWEGVAEHIAADSNVDEARIETKKRATMAARFLFERSGRSYLRQTDAKAGSSGSPSYLRVSARLTTM